MTCAAYGVDWRAIVMMHRPLLKLLLGALSLLACCELGYAQEPPAPVRLVVVELFQSQGCSSCPPAEANLNAIAGQPDILALSYGVTYWDSPGWKDTFATRAYTDRQWAYAKYRRRNNAWTSQAYVNGHADLASSDREKLDQAIADATSQGPQLVLAERPTRGQCRKPRSLQTLRHALLGLRV
ncbi:hypothetical protein B0E51_16835 [Rhodanobacter sp. C05]|nr:hypothetical protein B0E51_16835 [Rhodanobacter sp. C05]